MFNNKPEGMEKGGRLISFIRDICFLKLRALRRNNKYIVLLPSLILLIWGVPLFPSAIVPKCYVRPWYIITLIAASKSIVTHYISLRGSCINHSEAQSIIYSYTYAYIYIYIYVTIIIHVFNSCVCIPAYSICPSVCLLSAIVVFGCPCVINIISLSLSIYIYTYVYM